MQQYLIIIFLVISILLNLFLLIKIRGLIIKNINIIFNEAVPKEIRDLSLPYRGNEELVKDKSNYRYATMKEELNKEKRILPFLPFEKIYNVSWSGLYFIYSDKNVKNEKYETFFKYNPNYFDNLKKGDIIKSIQFRISTGCYFLLGEPSGRRKVTIPYDIDLDKFEIYLANMDEKDDLLDYYCTYNKLDIKLVKKGIKWNATDWPFGKEENNDFGPHIEFENDFVYTGGNLVLYFNFPKNSKDYLFYFESYKYDKNNIKSFENGEVLITKDWSCPSIKLGILNTNIYDI